MIKTENSFLTKSELREIGFKYLGDNVFISRKVSIYSPKEISIHDNTRIDDFCIISGKISIGKNVHIAAYSGLFGGKAGIKIEDFANVSSRVCIYALSDDYKGNGMTNPTIPDTFKKTEEKEVIIKKHVIIGSGSTILPGSTLNEGVAVGAMSMVKGISEAWMIYAGIPAKAINARRKDIIEEYERQYLNSIK